MSKNEAMGEKLITNNLKLSWHQRPTVGLPKLHQGPYVDWQAVGVKWIFNHHPEAQKQMD